MNTSKTLLQILVETLPKHGGWPMGVREIYQDWDFTLTFDGITDRMKLDELAIHHRKNAERKTPECIVTREQYEAAVLAATTQATITMPADGWIDWAGGECPVPEGVLVDVKLRCGSVTVQRSGDTLDWQHDAPDELGAIIAYRLHNQQGATTSENDYMLPHDFGPVDDESDLNECIGQGVAPVWNGEGLPPVGVEVQYSHKSKISGGWDNCIVTAIGEENLLMKTFDGEQWVEFNKRINAVKFRPANFERDEMAAIIKTSLDKCLPFVSATTLVATDLIAAGYRKQ